MLIVTCCVVRANDVRSTTRRGLGAEEKEAARDDEGDDDKGGAAAKEGGGGGDRKKKGGGWGLGKGKAGWSSTPPFIIRDCLIIEYPVHN